MSAPLFKPEYVAEALTLCDAGATDRDCAEYFEVSERTLNRWKAKHPEFGAVLKVGKANADARVEQSLYRRATGYSFDAVKIMQYEGAPIVEKYVEHVPPDTTACIFWLKNRRPDLWRDVRAVDVSGTVKHTHVNDLGSISAELAELHARLAGRRDTGGVGEAPGTAPPSGTHH